MGVWRVYWFLASYVSGILAVYLSPFFSIVPLGLVLLCLYCYFGLRRYTRNREFCVELFVVVFLFPFGVWRTSVAIPESVSPGDRERIVLEVLNDPLPDEKWVRFDVRLGTGDRLRVKIKRETFADQPFDCGDHVVVDATLSYPELPRNPGQFDYGRYLMSKGVSGLCRVNAVHQVTAEQGPLLRELAIHVRYFVHNQIRTVLPADYDNLYIGLLFGDYGVSLNEEWESQFRVLGLTHILVVSGAQVVLLNQILAWFITRFSVPIIIESGLIWLSNVVFVLLTGSGASIIRAALMCSIWYALHAMSFRTQGHFVLALSVLILTIASPLWLVQLGAILSMLACMALMVVSPLIRQRLPASWPRWVQEMVAVSISPFIVTTPIIWYSFQTISLISVVANMVALWAIELIVVVGFFGTFLGVLWTGFASVLHSASYALMVALVGFADFFSKLPLANIWVSAPFKRFPLLLYPIFVLLCLGVLLKRRILVSSSIVLGALFFASGLVYAIRPLSSAEITIFDVGQGDSILIETPNRTRILIDTGAGFGSFSHVKRTVIPALRAKGINRLDLVIITHWDADHSAGLGHLIAQYPNTKLMHNGRLPEKWHSVLSKSEVSLIEVKAGQLFDLGSGMEMRVLAPFLPDHGESKNDRSIVVQFRYGNQSVLFTGDLESIYERKLTHFYGTMLESDVLKLGHHGSKTSTTPAFLNAVQPVIGIVSAGASNRYGHPHPSVVNRLHNIHSVIYRTDTNGAIQITLNRAGYSVKPFNK